MDLHRRPGLPSWHRPEAVLSRARLAVMGRPGVRHEAVESAAGEVHWLDAPLLDISGTMLRARHRAGLSVRFLVPDAVLRYIESARLYTEG
ncbi:MAG: nicotinate-nicotinamide nucleotide adenylyltransferase [Acidobacteria bacterium]|nr:nicotinate-nicotinamide nucleotide adenylyltransferase [Acidobacteriota bacterium]